MTTTRTIDNSDLWSAIRGLGMYRMERSELIELLDAHKDNPLFASQVITEAARQVITTKPKSN